MKKLICVLFILFPTIAFGQLFNGTYRAVFVNLFSDQAKTVVEFDVRADNSITGIVTIGDLVKTVSGSVDKKGKFEAASPAEGNTTYKLKGKFDKNNNIFVIQRVQIGSGLNKSVTENALEGTFSKVIAVEKKSETPPATPNAELIDNGKSWIKLQHSNPLFGAEWIDLKARVTFSNSVERKTVDRNAADYFDLVVNSTAEGQRRIGIATRNYSKDQKIWKAADLRFISYREQLGSERNSFSAGDVMQTDSFYSGGTLEIVRETETQIVFRISNFRIKRFAKADFVELSGFIYADK